LLCLAKFDELTETGLEAFTRKYDPYWDVPLVETLPKPVIELPKTPEVEGRKVSEKQAAYGETDLFGNEVPTDLFGDRIATKGRRKNK